MIWWGKLNQLDACSEELDSSKSGLIWFTEEVNLCSGNLDLSTKSMEVASLGIEAWSNAARTRGERVEQQSLLCLPAHENQILAPPGEIAGQGEFCRHY